MASWIQGFGLTVIIFGLTAGCDPQISLDERSIGQTERTIIGGELTPEPFDFPIHALEANAAGAILYRLGTSYGQGCSGTLIGDRLVVSAGHCVVDNQQQWLNNGATPVLIPPEDIDFGIGDDGNNPLCQLETSEVHLHPEIAVTGAGILHDVSALVLNESVLETCPHVIPLQVNTAWLKGSMEGEAVLQGGFGSLDGTYNFSPIRYWSLTEVMQVQQDDLLLTQMGHGEPTYGDSGAGFLYRYPDGTLRVLSELSGGGSLGNLHIHFAIRLDRQQPWLGQLLESSDACGPVGAGGICLGHVAVHCDDHRFRMEDCEAQSTQCHVDGAGGARCGCACDLEPTCEDGCDCDPQCQCSTDCAQAGQECVVNEQGLAECRCACDLEPTCDDGCACDPQCPCSCDTSDTCDPDCPCDPDCTGPEPLRDSGGCAQSGGSAPFGGGLLLLLLGAFVKRGIP